MYLSGVVTKEVEDFLSKSGIRTVEQLQDEVLEFSRRGLSSSEAVREMLKFHSAPKRRFNHLREQIVKVLAQYG